MYVYTYVCMYVCVHVYINAHTYIHECLCNIYQLIYIYIWCFYWHSYIRAFIYTSWYGPPNSWEARQCWQRGHGKREAAVGRGRNVIPRVHTHLDKKKRPLAAAAVVGSWCLSGGPLSQKHCPFMLLLPFLKTETRDCNCCQDSLRGASIRTQWLKGSSSNLHKLPLTSGQRAVWNLSQEASCVAQGAVTSRGQMPASGSFSPWPQELCSQALRRQAAWAVKSRSGVSS